jgi:uncharacterized protein (TIGR03084 family)
MFQQPSDFRDESEELYRLLARLADADFERKTQFKDWTINDVLRHLHVWNWAARLSLDDPDAFGDFRARLFEAFQQGRAVGEFEKQWIDDAKGRALLEKWREFYLAMADRFAAADPKKRVAWAGPDMSVRSSITARLMETWAHGQEVYDLLGVEREDGDRIKNIAVLGVNTFGWTFTNRGLAVPPDLPRVELTAPSGETWTWNEPSDDNYVAGRASEFCQVVTQVRNVADTNLEVVGETARRWMSIAQCFAGGPEEPPAPGTRHRTRPER